MGRKKQGRVKLWHCHHTSSGNAGVEKQAADEYVKVGVVLKAGRDALVQGAGGTVIAG